MKRLRVVNNQFLVETGLIMLVTEIFDELVAKGWAIRRDRANELPWIDWTELGMENIADPDAFFDAALHEKVLGLSAPRLRENAPAGDVA